MTDHLKYIEKLNGDNYGIWKIRMKALLVHRNLWKFVCPTILDGDSPSVHQQPGSDENTSAPSTAAPSTASDDSQSLEKSQQAMSLILLAMNDSQIIHCDECDTARKAWVKLQKLYEEPSTANRMRLYEKFLTAKMDKSITVRAHVENFSSVRSQLKSVGVNIDEGLYKLALLRSLSQRYDHLFVTLENQVDSLNIKDLHARIYREEVCQDSTEERTSQALSAQFKPSSSRSGDNRRKKCFYCGKKGHVRADCFKRKNEEQQSRSSLQQHSTKKSDGHFLMALDSGCDQGKSTWYIDSGASFHICKDQKLFNKSPEELSIPKNIEIGNGSQIIAKHKGDVDIVSTTKFGEYTLKVRDALYIPDSAVNLLSVAQITKRGYAVVFYREACKIIDPQTDEEIIKLPMDGTGYRFNATSIDNVNRVLHSYASGEVYMTAVL